MKTVVAVRCFNEEKNITRFLRGYDFCDEIVVSDGGSTDYSVDIIKYHQKYNPKIHLLHFDQRETVNGQTWNPDHPHMNFVLDEAKKLDPTFLIFDDMDCTPTAALKRYAGDVFTECLDVGISQVNVFRLYMWGDKEYFPHMNRNFHEDYRSVWAWRPDVLDIRADPSVRHGTLIGLSEAHMKIDPPCCVLHKSWYPETIDAKIDRYNKLGLPMEHPLSFAGEPELLPDWAHE